MNESTPKWDWDKLRTELYNLDASLRLQSAQANPDHHFIGPSLVELAINACDTAIMERDRAQKEVTKWKTFWVIKDDKYQILFKACRDRIGGWLSASLDDPSVCEEMKTDVRAWFEALGPLEEEK